ncbi:MAG: malonyl-CoA O-methyltransferase [Bradymonadia bacterium]|jgi:malonyl-CoA O-methyltransferase
MDARFFQATYDRFAAQYDATFEAQQRPKIEGLLAAVGAHEGPRLDAGCGTCLAARITGLPFIGLDASGGMLRKGAGQRVQGDLYRLPFADRQFGLVLCVTALIDFADPTPAIDELWRVLRPGGVLAVSVLARERITGLYKAFKRLGSVSDVDLPPDVGFVIKRSPR